MELNFSKIGSSKVRVRLRREKIETIIALTHMKAAGVDLGKVVSFLNVF